MTNDENFKASQRIAFASGTLCLVIVIIIAIWGIFDPSLRPKPKKPLEVHTHTITFTCTRTCTDLTKIPEVLPWQN